MNKKIIKNKKDKKIINFLIIIIAVIVFVLGFKSNVYAQSEGGDPLAVISNTNEYLFKVLSYIGTFMLGYGVVQLGLSLKSHDPSQKDTGIMYIASGAMITFTKQIVDLIVK